MGYVTVEVKDHIAYVTIDKPPANTFNLDLYQEVGDTFQSFNDRKDIWTVILSSKGKYFCAGNDVADFKGTSDPEVGVKYATKVKDCMIKVYTCNRPVIVAVHGYALGAGLALVSVCDIIIASEDAKFGIPEIKVGIVGASGFARLVSSRNMGRYLAFSGNMLTAQQLDKYGNIHAIVPKDKLLEEATKVAKEFMANAPMALELFKKAMNDNEEEKLDAKYMHEVEFGKLFRPTKDRNEAVAAFLEKRQPQFTGE